MATIHGTLHTKLAQRVPSAKINVRLQLEESPSTSTQLLQNVVRNSRSSGFNFTQYIVHISFSFLNVDFLVLRDLVFFFLFYRSL